MKGILEKMSFYLKIDGTKVCPILKAAAANSLLILASCFQERERDNADLDSKLFRLGEFLEFADKYSGAPLSVPMMPIISTHLSVLIQNV